MAWIATKTLEAIDAAIMADQGKAYRGHLSRLLPLAGDVYRQDEEDFRTHMGASIIGRECHREIWLGFHWAKVRKFEGRMVRLFNRGHMEEPRLVAALLCVPGVQVWQFDTDGNQFRINDHNGHFGGSLDGVALGIPDLPAGVPCLTEFKTHNTKSFTKIAGKKNKDTGKFEGGEGVMKAKWEHFVQKQIYMGKMGLTHALYLAVNKDNDDIYGEIVQFDPMQYERNLAKAGTLIALTVAPAKINSSPGWFGCRFCDMHPLCHTRELPARNCRTCHFSTPIENKEWFCRQKQINLDKGAQLSGCDQYEMNASIKG